MAHVLREAEEAHAADKPIDAYADRLDPQIRRPKQMRHVVLVLRLFLLRLDARLVRLDGRRDVAQGYAVFFRGLRENLLCLVGAPDRQQPTRRFRDDPECRFVSQLRYINSARTRAIIGLGRSFCSLNYTCIYGPR